MNREPLSSAKLVVDYVLQDPDGTEVILVVDGCGQLSFRATGDSGQYPYLPAVIKSGINAGSLLAELCSRQGLRVDLRY